MLYHVKHLCKGYVFKMLATINIKERATDTKWIIKLIEYKTISHRHDKKRQKNKQKYSI